MASSKGQRKITVEVIQGAYLEFLNKVGQKPESVAQFCEYGKFKETEFYQHFESFQNLRRHIWYSILRDTLQVLEVDQEYPTFSVREKLLAFYFTHMEILQNYRAFVKSEFSSFKIYELIPYSLQTYRAGFTNYCNIILREGMESGEIANRKFISDYYEQGFWIQLLYVLKFWVNDNSQAYENTDTAIEKAVNLSFDLIARGALDSLIDFAKFNFQNRNHFC